MITKFVKFCREMTAKFKISAAKWPQNCRFSLRNDREIHVFDLSRYREIWHNLPRQTNAPDWGGGGDRVKMLFSRERLEVAASPVVGGDMVSEN